MKLIISEEEKKSILSLHSSYGYKSYINEQELTPSRPEGPQNEPVGQEQGVVKIDEVPVTTTNLNMIKGVVKDKDGNPLPNVKITLKDKQGNSVYKGKQNGEEYSINLEGTTNEKGEYTIRAIYKENSPYTLTASLEGYTTSNKKFRKGDEGGNLSLTMEKPKPPKPPKPDDTEEPKTDNTEEPTTTPEETKPVKPLSKRSMERLNSKVFKDLVDEFKRENLIFYIQTSETGQDPLQLEIDKGGNFEVDYNPSVVTIPTKDPKNNQPNGSIIFDCNMNPVILMRMGEDAYKSSLKYDGKPYYQIHMPKKYGDDWIKTNYCNRLVSRLENGTIVAPYDNR
jgi:hypothetical protein